MSMSEQEMIEAIRAARAEGRRTTAEATARGDHFRDLAAELNGSHREAARRTARSHLWTARNLEAEAERTTDAKSAKWLRSFAAELRRDAEAIGRRLGETIKEPAPAPARPEPLGEVPLSESHVGKRVRLEVLLSDGTWLGGHDSPVETVEGFVEREDPRTGERGMRVQLADEDGRRSWRKPDRCRVLEVLED